MVKYIPEKGDIIWLDFTPQSGHEQAGHRPAIVISPKEYNKNTTFCIVAPITSISKGYPFEVAITNKKIQGFCLCDQLKSLDYVDRRAEFIEKASVSAFNKIADKFSFLLQKI